MGFFEGSNLSEPYQRAGMFCFVAESIYYLVDLDREISMGSDPYFVHRVNGSLTCWAKGQRDVKRVFSSMGYPVHLVFKAFDMLGFFHELVFGDKQWKESFLVSAVVKDFPYNIISIPPDCKAERVPDIEPFYRIADIHYFGHPQEFVIPFAEFLFWRECCFFFAFCHTFTVLSQSEINS